MVSILGPGQAKPIATAQMNVSGVAVDDSAIYGSTYDAASGAGRLMKLAK